MDSSSSTSAAGSAFSDRVIQLLDGIISTEVTVKVGVVKFRGLAFDTIDLVSNHAQSGLVEYSEATSKVIEDAIKVEEGDLKPEGSDKASRGSNIHGGLKVAESMLSSDTEVSDDHKFVILVSDGKSYIWYDENNIPTTFFSQYFENSFHPSGNNASLTPKSNQYIGRAKDNPNVAQSVTNSTGFNVFAFYANGLQSYPDLYAYADNPDCDPALLAELSGSCEFDEMSRYAYGGFAEIPGTPVTATSAPAISNVADSPLPLLNDLKNYYPFVPDEGYEDIFYFQVNPYEVIKNNDGTYSYDYSKPNPYFYMAHPDPMQKGTYLAGHLWTDMNEKYTTAFIGYDGPNHDKLNGGGLAIAKSFFNWMQQPDISDFSCNIVDDEGLTGLFSAVENKINYLIQTGTVTDIIPDEFTLVENGTETFTVTLKDSADDTNAADENGGLTPHSVEGGNGWVYGEADADSGKYPYEVYYDESAKTITWVINVPVENAKPVSLSYTLEIDEDAKIGYHDTNVSAVLDYTSTDGTTGKFEFEIPVVEYLFEPVTEFTIAKTYLVGEGYDDAGSKIDTQGLLEEDVVFTIAPYKSFNREVDATGALKTAIPAFDPASYTITVGDGDDTVTVTLPEFSSEEGVGDYWYTLKETAGTTAGVTYDDNTYYLHLTVIHRGSSVGIVSAQIHKSAPADDGSFENNEGDKTTEFTNEYSAGSLTVEKKVTGNMGDRNKVFEVTVVFTAPEGKTVTGDITSGEDSNGDKIVAVAGGWTGSKTVTITLSDGESVTYENIPDGVTYTVTEADYTVDGYDAAQYAFDNQSEDGDTVSESAAGTVSDSADKVTITNNKDAIIDVGVIINNAPFVIIFAISAMAVASLALLRRKHN